MRPNYQKLTRLLGETRVLINEPLSKYSSFRIGGPADLFFRAKTSADLIAAVLGASSLGIPFFVVGGCTNLLISDKGFCGLIIKNDTSQIKFAGAQGDKKVRTVYLQVESGVGINRLVRFCLDQGYCGIQAFMGQPGTVGGAVWINAHNISKGQFFGEKIISAKLIDHHGKEKEVSNKYFHFAYDYSICQKTKEVVVSVVLALQIGDKKTLWKEATNVLKYRQQTQPQGKYSSGCTFRNIEKSDAVRLATPEFTCSAGYLLESVGLKGYKVGSVQFSEAHANFIVHQGEGTASDVLKLISLAKEKVRRTYGVDLKEEIVLVGEF
ncbi:UDP-N-acetylmuramate dehydrogenase [Candidatus Gottesmanbacteria bacterium]|nr:UDP-N-acetylmuramate dehydrogenase [Candidatus Gottesmanbacteria bacterium]